MGRGRSLYIFHALIDESVQVKWLGSQRQFPRLHARDIQQIADEVGELIELGIHAREVMESLRIPLFCQATLEYIGKAFETRHGCFQFVACHADELVLAAFDEHTLRNIVDNTDDQGYLSTLISHRARGDERPAYEL